MVNNKKLIVVQSIQREPWLVFKTSGISWKSRHATAPDSEDFRNETKYLQKIVSIQRAPKAANAPKGHSINQSITKGKLFERKLKLTKRKAQVLREDKRMYWGQSWIFGHWSPVTSPISIRVGILIKKLQVWGQKTISWACKKTCGYEACETLLHLFFVLDYNIKLWN